MKEIYCPGVVTSLVLCFLPKLTTLQAGASYHRSAAPARGAEHPRWATGGQWRGTGAEGIWGQGLPVRLSIFFCPSMGSPPCPWCHAHGAAGCAKCNPRPAPGSSLQPASRCSLQPQKWFLAGCRCAEGICCHSEPALFGRAVVVWHLLE